MTTTVTWTDTTLDLTYVRVFAYMSPEAFLLKGVVETYEWLRLDGFEHDETAGNDEPDTDCHCGHPECGAC